METMENQTVVKSLNFLKNVTLPIDKSNIQETTDSFRLLRNYCANGKAAQNFALEDPLILVKAQEVVVSVLGVNYDETNNLCLLLALQFIANSLVGNKENQRIIWDKFGTLLWKCLDFDEGKVKHCTAMIMYNILRNNEEFLQQIDSPCTNIIALAMNEQGSEYPVYILELLVFKTQYVIKYYRQLSVEQRLMILSIIEDTNESWTLTPAVLSYIGQYFLNRCPLIPEASSNGMNDLDAQEISMVLDILNSTSSSSDENLKGLQENGDILVTAVGLLRTIHALSKKQGNHFSMLLKMSDLEDERNVNIEDRPEFGFKAGLVRLIGNMCYQNRPHQDSARELGAIPLILDCCNIDARNPLIIQWAVLAMRNLCKNNIENQHVVASVDQRGDVDRGRLAELGLLFNGR